MDFEKNREITLIDGKLWKSYNKFKSDYKDYSRRIHNLKKQLKESKTKDEINNTIENMDKLLKQLNVKNLKHITDSIGITQELKNDGFWSNIFVNKFLMKFSEE